MYSEQKNWLTKGQILLVGQITAQGTKINSWEIMVTKLGILSFVVPNSKYSTCFVDLILTLEWVPLDQSVFLLTPFLPKSHDMTWLNLKYYVTWPSTVYETPSVQLYPQLICPVGHREKGLLCSKRVNLAIRWPLRWMSATLLFQGFTPMSAALPPGSMVGTRTGLNLRGHPPPH